MESKGTTVVASCIHQALTGSYRYTTLADTTDDHRAEYLVKRMCTVLKLTRSSFYKWKATHTRRVARTCADGVLGARIAAVFEEENGLYGAKRITASLNEAKEFARVNHKKVARIMKNMKLRGFTKRRRCVTTKRSTTNPVFANLVKRRLHA